MLIIINKLPNYFHVAITAYNEAGESLASNIEYFVID